ARAGFDRVIRISGIGNVVRNCMFYVNERGQAVGGTPGTSGFDQPADIQLLGNGNRIGGTTLADRNVITGAGGACGVRVGGISEGAAHHPTGSQILGNVIGTDGTLGGAGSAALSNFGVQILGVPSTTVSLN